MYLFPRFKFSYLPHFVLSPRRAEEIDDLIRSGEAYDDLILKCGEGQAFYQDISERLSSLQTELEQINAAIDDLQRVVPPTQPSIPTPQQPSSAFSVPMSGKHF